MQERIKEHDRDIRLAKTQASALSEHAYKNGHRRQTNSHL